MARARIVEGGPKEKYIHVRFRNPPRKGSCRTPAWASKASGSVSKGSKVRMCNYSDGWDIQSVLITKKGHNKTQAKKLARKVRNKIKRKKK